MTKDPQSLLEIDFMVENSVVAEIKGFYEREETNQIRLQTDSPVKGEVVGEKTDLSAV